MLLTSYGQAGTNLKGLQMVKDSNIGSKKRYKKCYLPDYNGLKYINNPKSYQFTLQLPIVYDDLNTKTKNPYKSPSEVAKAST